ncbi:MAG: hypothetical protein EBX52_03300 [Proteobacteria bacterium]|nr:hypothetical protein [Pseudomonadota bacterium]
MEKILKSALRVVSESEGIVKVALPGDRSLANKTQVLFFRKKGIRLDMIATGLVRGESSAGNGGGLLLEVELDKDAITKYPHEGDFAAPMSDPNAFGAGDKKEQFDFLMPVDPDVVEKQDLPGYLEAGTGLFYGNLSSTTNSVVNESKASSGYRFAPIRFSYFLHFAPVGIDYEKFSGNFPTRTYQGSKVVSAESVSHLTFSYRFGPFLKKKLEIQGQIDTLSRTFTTDNPDESLISSKMSGLGIGAKAVYWFKKSDWVREKGESFIQLDRVYLGARYYPFYTVTDNTISRGSASSGSSAYELRAGMSLVAYLGFIPFFHHWFAEASTGYVASSLKFTGPTVQSTQPFPATIPEGSGATEKELDVRFIFGFRIEDPLFLLFSSKKAGVQ